MYEQICEVLKQNNFPFKDILWVDEFGKFQLNNSEEWTEYIEDPVDKGICFYFAECRKYFKCIQQLHLGFTTVILLEELWNEADKNNE